MLTTNAVDRLLANNVNVICDGDKLGTIGQAFMDDRTGEPTWLTIKMGLFGWSTTLDRRPTALHFGWSNRSGSRFVQELPDPPRLRSARRHRNQSIADSLPKPDTTRAFKLQMHPSTSVVSGFDRGGVIRAWSREATPTGRTPDQKWRSGIALLVDMTRTAHPMIPVAPPYQIDDFLTSQETDALFGVVKNHGPWRLINALYFDNADDYLAVAGGKNRSPNAKLSDYLNPGFRGILAQNGVCYYDELHDFYFNKRLIELAKGLHGAEYGLADHLQFNIAGPSHSRDAGHFDGATWRGLNLHNCPLWLLTLMAKSGLFNEYKVKTAQIITYFYESGIDGGFTYWPNGPDRAPQRFAAPFHNTAVVSDNSEMYHRREANGPREQRDYPDLDLQTKVHWGGDGQWVMTNDDTEFARFGDEHRRVLFHWTGLVFLDRAEVTQYLEHTNDLTVNRAFEVFIADLQSRGIRFTEPSDPLHDPAFFQLLNTTYAMSPDEYPAEAPYEPLSV